MGNDLTSKITKTKHRNSIQQQQAVRGMDELQQHQEDQINALNLELQSAIKDLENQGVDCRQFKEGFGKFSRGRNFEGIINEDGEVVGLARYYSKVESYHIVFYGRIRDNRFWGPGILLKRKQVNHQHLSLSRSFTRSFTITNMEDELSVTYIKDWSATDELTQGMMKITHNDKEILFKGNFKIDENFDNEQEPTYISGEMAIKQDSILTLTYKGEFKNNNFSGQGELTIVGKIAYKGEFLNNQRSGYGIQDDLVKKTRFIGEFSGDKRNGYGELIYINRENVRLKGFWVDNKVRPGEGIYCTANGRVLNEVSADDITMH